MSPFNYKTTERAGEGGGDAGPVCVHRAKESSAVQNRGGPEWMTTAFLTFFLLQHTFDSFFVAICTASTCNII